MNTINNNQEIINDSKKKPNTVVLKFICCKTKLL